MRKLVVFSVLGVAFLAALGGGVHWWTVGRFFESTDDAYVQSDITIVAPKVEGYIREVRVQQNQLVAAGDVLAIIEDRDFVARADQVAAALEIERATLGTIESRIVLQRSMIDQATAQMASAEADVKRAAMDHQRYRNLLRDDFASRQRYETAEADARKAEAALLKTRAAFAAEKAQLGVLEAQRLEGQARVKQATAQLALARHNLDDTVIRAPVAGVAGNKAVQVGQFVKAGMQLVALVPLAEIYVTANFKETQLAHMRPGQPVELSVDAYPGERIAARVESFSPASGAQFSLLPPENATGNFTKVVQRVPVRLAVPADNRLAGLLRPGLSVAVAVDTRGETRHGGSLARLLGVAPAVAGTR